MTHFDRIDVALAEVGTTTRTTSGLAASALTLLLLSAGYRGDASAADHGVRFGERSDSTNQRSADTELGSQALLASLAQVHQQLVRSQTEFTPEEMDAVYSNLWELYD